jgi:hypothetical protein
MEDFLTLKFSNLKVPSLICAGLKPHTVDILADTTLLNTNIPHLIKTSLETREDVLLTIPGYRSHFINVGNGKGIAKFYKD